MLQIQRKICFNVNNIFLQKCKKRECRVYNFLFKRYVSTSLSERELILVTTDFFHCISVETVQVQSFFKVRKSSSVALESTSINFIFFRTYYLFNQFIKNRQENFCNRKCYIYPLPRTIIQIINENSIFRKEGIVKSHLKLKLEQYKLNKTGVISGCQSS